MDFASYDEYLDHYDSGAHEHEKELNQDSYGAWRDSYAEDVYNNLAEMTLEQQYEELTGSPFTGNDNELEDWFSSEEHDEFVEMAIDEYLEHI